MQRSSSSSSSKKEPFLIGVAGGISSGKSSVCRKIIEELAKLNKEHPKHVLILSLDSFYKRLSDEERARAERHELNLDHPDAWDDELAYNTLSSLRRGESVTIPQYDKKTYQFVAPAFQAARASDSVQSNEPESETDIDVLIIEGILVFYYPKIRDLCQMKLFVDCDADTRLARRVSRDMKEFNRPLDQILTYYQRCVKPAFEEFTLPTKKYADVIIPRGSENHVAINLIVQHLNDYLNSAAAAAVSSDKLSGLVANGNGNGRANNAGSSGGGGDGGGTEMCIEEETPATITYSSASSSPQKPNALNRTVSSPGSTKKGDFASSRPH